MNNIDTGHGAEIAVGLRSCSSIILVPIIAICSGIIIGKEYGTAVGILGGIVCSSIFFKFYHRFIATQINGLTVLDCLIPFLVSLVSGVIFAPVSLFSASVFSIATCIYSGVLLSATLFLYKAQKVSAGYLVFPFLVFMYEILPIELPTDIDNILALSGNTAHQFIALTAAKMKGQLLGEKRTSSNTSTNEEETVIDVDPE